MTEHVILEVLFIVCIVLVLALALTHSERNHYKHEYESLRNEVLREGQERTRSVVVHLQGVHERAMALDEMIDSQG